ncbi:hypothetical protein M2G93_13245 [Vibrio vulnificus]|uniref:hypothetical protein n=1 Tax=Vibrio vulnificus TaxID=672 RepID=UPI0005768A8D|nr:hypothetical protein [Vibrio vulnificus]EGQ7950904.1 hypothetical protein [Vibrio vulnificus]EGQ7984131.1 hypothetical protein [Vibrio vulnificus]MCU8149075.1 hypothetical protein [Vibrio vulnificus]RZR38731.1 hypothetical protein D8T59_10365 [Vibrio vulnificus]HAS8110979.1 hypothetical protein [Vibrio vulnificus]
MLEVTGVPCSGKSYILNSKFSCDNVLNKHLAIKLVSLCCAFLELKYTEIGRIIKMVFKEQCSFLYKLKLLFNVLSKFGVYYLYRNKSIIIDEGISHIPFNLLTTPLIEYKDILQVRLCDIDVLLLSSPNFNVLTDRFNSRGHPRLDFISLNEFMELNSDVYTKVLQEYPKICKSLKVY